MTNAADWTGRVGHNWAAEWRRTDRSFAALTPQLLAAIAACPGERLLDIGCGAGELTLALARARPTARVTGVDISAELIAAARTRGADVANAAFVVADAARWPGETAAPDLIVSRHGVMFFADPVAAFAHLATLAAPGAALVFSCFRAVAENPWATELLRGLPANAAAAPAPDPHAPGPFAPGPFAFADPDRVRAILSAAGWAEVRCAAADFPYVAGEGADAPATVADALAYLSRIGPAAAALGALDEADRAAAVARIVALLEARCDGGRVTFPAAAWLVRATRA